MNAEKKSILIAEDEADNREILRTVVEDILGYRAVLAGDGASALQAIAKEIPALILMDLMMPVIDGFEAIVTLKRDAATATIPIIAVTALSRPADRQKALDCGAENYISKPFDLDRLIGLIEELTASEPIS